MRRKHKPMRISGKKKINKWGRVKMAPPLQIIPDKRRKKPKHRKPHDELDT